jgi:hypothetical protein
MTWSEFLLRSENFGFALEATDVVRIVGSFVIGKDLDGNVVTFELRMEEPLSLRFLVPAEESYA